MSKLKTQQAIAFQKQLQAVRREPNYKSISNQQLQELHKSTLNVLKLLQGRLDKQLQSQRKNMGNGGPQSKTDQFEIVSESIKNNENVIKFLEKQVKKLKERREVIKDGYESKLSNKRMELQKKINDYKQQLKRMKLQQNENNKKLNNNSSQPQILNEHLRLQQQLKSYSVKYVKLMDKYNRVTQQLAIASNTPDLPINIPEEIYDKDLQEREQAQYKEYQGIVKLCTILSKRNDSQSNKFNRQYTTKLRQLQKIIINLGQIDRMIALREGEVIEGKKNLQLIRYQVNNSEKIDDQLFMVSQSSRRHTFSTPRLPMENLQVSKQEYSRSKLVPRKLSKIN